MTESKPTPRNLDPKFKDVETPTDAVNGSDQSESTVTESRTEYPEDTPMTVYRVPFTDSSGVQRTKEYGPMPTAEFLTWLPKFEAGKVDGWDKE